MKNILILTIMMLLVVTAHSQVRVDELDSIQANELSANDFLWIIDDSSPSPKSRRVSNYSLGSHLFGYGFNLTALSGAFANKVTSSPTLSNNPSNTLTTKGYVDGQIRTDEQIEDITGGMFGGNTETLITATYQDIDGTVDLVVEDDLAFYDNSTSGFLTSEIDGSTTNEIQDLSLTGNTLSLTNDGTTVDLSAYLDNTDTQLNESQVDAFVANNGYLTSEVDGSTTNEIQTLDQVLAEGNTSARDISVGSGTFSGDVTIDVGGSNPDLLLKTSSTTSGFGTVRLVDGNDSGWAMQAVHSSGDYKLLRRTTGTESAVVSINSAGNATFSGDVSAQNLNLTNKLDIDRSTNGTYFEGGANSTRRLTISAEDAAGFLSAGHRFNIDSGGGAFFFSNNNGDLFNIDRLGNATFSGKVTSASTTSGDAGTTLTTKDYVDVKVSSDVTGISGASTVTNIVRLSQAEYDAIGTPDASTLYIIE